MLADHAQQRVGQDADDADEAVRRAREHRVRVEAHHRVHRARVTCARAPAALKEV